jgi:hypothetical protein
LLEDYGNRLANDFTAVFEQSRVTNLH